ncbi:DUF983 domain-containing protein [uncultured Enterovirga sp.]|uniref:DUF983 domain-containing protein n=1 Tax=uncultured Enterovirga sp. TaxID=2026352 RepID=UPI0035CA0F27
MAFDRATPPALTTGWRGRCPRCGRGHLFDGYLTVSPRCEVCGLDFAFADSGDGPAFFVMSFVGIVVVGLAMMVEFTYEPPLWVHALLWGPTMLGLSLALLRPAKGLLIALQFGRKAEQGRLKS